MTFNNKSYFYCDESGNSGSNYLDTNQPFFILSGWLIPEKVINDTNITESFKKIIFIKGNLNYKIRNLSTINKILDKFFELKCLPVAVILEKRFAIAAKVVETFLDPEYNNKIQNSFLYDSKLKQDYANSIYLLKNSTLEEFINAYLTHDIALMKLAINDLHSELESKGENELSELILNASKCIEQNFEDEKKSSNYYPYKTMQSLNLPMVVVLFNMLELIGLNSDNSIYIVHDAICQYQDGILDTFNKYSKAIKGEFTFTDGTKIITGYDFLKSISFESSSSNLWLQLSDTLSYLLNDTFKRINKSKNLSTTITNNIKKLLFLLFSFSEPGLKICHSMFSSNFDTKISKYFSIRK